MDMVCTSCLGVNETDQSQPVTVYPNPASKNINVSVNTITNEVLKLKFMNALGTVVYAETIDNSGKLTRSINVEGLADGIYFLKLEGKKLNYSQKVTVQH